jgi:thiol:disulfide interchange protein
MTRLWIPALGAAVIAWALATSPAPAQDASIGLPKRQIYPSINAAPADLKAALAEARLTHKRVIVDFGGDWCPDCQVLNFYFNASPNAELTRRYFVRVNVNVGRMDANKDMAAQFGMKLQGVPALAVLDEDGRVLYAQNGEFADMRHLDATALGDFLNRWKPAR